MDKHDQESEQGNFEATDRNSVDTSKTDIRGEELLELWKALNFMILNGRKNGDPFGEITSYQWKGKAVVDYVVSSLELFDSITYFKVGDYSPFISDHCPLFYEMHSKIGPKKTNDESLREYPSTFFLNSQDKEKLIESLKSPEIEGKLRALNTSALDPQSMVSVISTTLIEACSKANIKAKRKSSKLKNDDPWFDKDCKKVKNSIKRKCQLLRNDSSKTNLHFEIFVENKLFKNMLKKKEKRVQTEHCNRNDYKKGGPENILETTRKTE